MERSLLFHEIQIDFGMISESLYKQSLYEATTLKEILRRFPLPEVIMSCRRSMVVIEHSGFGDWQRLCIT